MRHAAIKGDVITIRGIYILTICCAIVWSGCALFGLSQSDFHSFKKPVDNLRDSVESSISLERTLCYGDCPMYKVLIARSGDTWLGARTPPEYDGEDVFHVYQIDSNRVKFLFVLADTIGFPSLKDKYEDFSECDVLYTDYPYAIITLKIGDSSKTVSHYLGCFSTVPELGKLYELENAIDSIAQTKKYISLEGGPFGTTRFSRPDTTAESK